MKKLFTSVLIFLVCFAAFSEDTSSSSSYKTDFIKDVTETSAPAYTYIGTRFVPTNARMAAMGGAGLALVDSGNGLFVNPASLSEGRFRLSLPSVSFTLYHAYAALKKDSEGKNLINRIQDNDKNALITAIVKVVGTDVAPLFSIDADTSVTLPFGLGFGIYARDTVYTYSGKAVNEFETSLALGYAYGFDLGSVHLSAGASAKMNVVAFNKGLGIDAVINSEDIKAMTLDIAAGYSLPVIDLGVTAEWKGLSASLVASNLFSKYRFSIIETSLYDAGEAAKQNFTYNDLTIESDPVFDFGLGYEFETPVVDASVAVDLKDIRGLFSCMSSTDRNRVLLRHLNAGVELSFIDTVALRAGLSSGYITVGTAIDLYALRIEAAYYWNEMGDGAGQRGLDGLTIRFNLGYER